MWASEFSSTYIVSAGTAGTIIEFFECMIYASVSALLFGQLFLGVGNELVSAVLVWGTFAAGHLARPLSAIAFDHFGNQFSRSNILFVTLVMMGLLTTLIVGLLPTTYAQLGAAAPIVVVVLRIVKSMV
ncbi:MHS family MFS transporter [Mycobacterium sp. CBMA293]|uniref:hypothetical protein n=1 Tax=unclassified Mycolicibacterium TaxID=2636767 RepID=UPI0012DBFA37|nr:MULTISPECIES: hypothetical protein [unclassified Mycolicibacterium]MUL50136.1 MHS family MFS transporter [Mycolicibacterium sp. CBMA 360]MUL62793.1 MHS family MFS transporter [Mycolicibacterium sp. CBMA 335]MUL69603.1 MHS family MFS transporter [Mycolicibacterium sp. CBMA 311]MUL97444.1 MHS family MFS transporter [Mycolicibacterium sp. CBMA 230]MUM05005.1 hypothetical protein [Mycolicibacterium sp. CBMA 213]